MRRCLETHESEDAVRDSQFVAIQLWAWLHVLADLRISKPEMRWPSLERLVDATLSDLRLSG